MRPARPTEPAAATRPPAALWAVEEELDPDEVAVAEPEPEEWSDPPVVEAPPVVAAPEVPEGDEPPAVAPEEPAVPLSWTEVLTQLVLVPFWIVMMDEYCWLPLESFNEIVKEVPVGRSATQV